MSRFLVMSLMLLVISGCVVSLLASSEEHVNSAAANPGELEATEAVQEMQPNAQGGLVTASPESEELQEIEGKENVGSNLQRLGEGFLQW